MAEKDHPDVLVPPPAALVLCVCAGWLFDRVWPKPFLPASAPHGFAGGVLIALGLAIGFWSVVQFRRAQTSVRPDRPTSAILATGPYRFSRNPIYLGMLILVAGLGIALDSLWQFAALVALYAVLRWGVVAREETYLRRKFGAAYTDYAARVRRWI
jgi:protein-S-isoprenylcysteine O-methyltransferase Ste14